MPPAPASVTSDADDDVGRIEGIEPWIADLLRKCGVRNVVALAALSPEALATALRERAFVELTTERIDREDWLGQARRLSGAAERPTESGATGPGANREGEGTGDIGGQQAAGFSLFFDTVRDKEGKEAWQTRV